MAEEEKIELRATAKIPKEPAGWLETKLPKSVMKRLQSYIEVAKKNPVNYNSTLAGNISESLIIKDKDNWFFQTILFPHINKFMECYPTYVPDISVLTEDAPFCLDKLWVNFQKQHEFNPFHNHKGVFSFVVWVKIPTDYKEQHALPISSNSNMPKASNFEFQYISMLGAITYYEYLLDKKSEGKMLFFPAKLNHAVHPFYNCDRERISISGNIKFDISENAMRQYRSYQ